MKKILSAALVILAGFALPNLATAQSGCVARPPGLISWWPGNDNSNDMMGMNHATLINEATFAPGMVGQAFTFDGVDDYAQAGGVGLPTGNTDRTLELWAKIDAFVAAEAFFAGYGSFGTYDNACVLGSSDRGNRVFFSQWGRAVTGPSLELNRWYHVAATSIGDFATLYLDGMAVASGTIPINTSSGTDFYMGRIPGGLGEGRRLQGQVDEVGIYDRALTDLEIAAIYDAGIAGKCRDATPPSLRFRRVDQTLVFTWPVVETGFVLESADSLSLPKWIPSPTPTVVIGDQQSIVVDIEGAAQFYRLRKM